MRKKKVIVYRRNLEDFQDIAFPTDCLVSYANPRFFTNPKAGVDYFISNEKRVIEAHEKIGIPQYPFQEGSVRSEDSSADVAYMTQDSSEFICSEPLPGDWRDLPFPKMRSLAKRYTNEVLRNGEQVKEMLELIEEQQAK